MLDSTKERVTLNPMHPERLLVPVARFAHRLFAVFFPQVSGRLGKVEVFLVFFAGNRAHCTVFVLANDPPQIESDRTFASQDLAVD